MKNFINNQRGNVMIIVALGMVVFMGMAALSIDLGISYVTKSNLQKAADAAALAGAQDIGITGTDPKDTAITYAHKNNMKPSLSDKTVSGSTYTATNSEDTVTVTAPDSTKIKVVCARVVNNTFARVLGINQTTVKASAVAQKQPSTDGYAIFSGGTSELILNGGGINVVGAVHTNGNFKADGLNIKVSGNCEAVGSVTATDPSLIPNKMPGSGAISLADYVESVGIADLASSETAAATAHSGDMQINANPSTNIYASGKIEIKTDSLHITKSIIADGDIYIDAEHLVLDCPIIYSKNGKIEVKKGYNTINGILYSPASDVIINNSGGGVVVNGRIVGNFVRLNGPGITVDSSSAAASSGGGVKLIE